MAAMVIDKQVQYRLRKVQQVREECNRIFFEHEVDGFMSLEDFYISSAITFSALRLPDPPRPWKEGAFRNFCDTDEN